jgi:hypothetical protein
MKMHWEKNEIGLWVPRRPRGVVELRVERDGKLLRVAKFDNLFLNAGLPALAALLGGAAGSWDAVAVGFGSSGTAPTVADAAVTAPLYYKAVDGAVEDGAGSVTFAWSLVSGTDVGAYGITIQEIALFANHAAVALPGVAAPAPILARRTFAPIVYAVGVNISGTWQLTF